jgi:UDP-hydrolysing UDP-N-acetyl-D-glucosamine 2-epimerase
LGDRFETFAAAIVAHNLDIPIYHLQGGDTTPYSLDEGYRNCITQLATVHLAATQKSAERINKPYTFNVGSLCCVIPILPEIEKKYDIAAIFHPYQGNYQNEFLAMLEFLKDKNVIYFTTGADAGGKWINERLPNKNSLDRNNFLAILQHCDYIIGNSSSGITEAPTLNIPTINIGKRQFGRERAESVIDCEGTVEAIKEAVTKIKDLTDDKFINPYYKEDTINRIVEIIYGQPNSLIPKSL